MEEGHPARARKGWSENGEEERKKKSGGKRPSERGASGGGRGGIPSEAKGEGE